MKFKKEMLKLYAVTDRSWLGTQTLYEQVELALKGGVTMVQLREKQLDEKHFEDEARELLALCHRYEVPLLINDNVELAKRIDADGVHIGQSDMTLDAARKLLGSDKIIGVTAKTTEQAKEAQAGGADYLGSGAMFGSSTKLDAKPMERATLLKITESTKLPVVAIGGISAENAGTLSGCGIAGIAVVSGLFASKDIEAEARKLYQIASEITEQS